MRNAGQAALAAAVHVGLCPASLASRSSSPRRKLPVDHAEPRSAAISCRPESLGPFSRFSVARSAAFTRTCWRWTLTPSCRRRRASSPRTTTVFDVPSVNVAGYGFRVAEERAALSFSSSERPWRSSCARLAFSLSGSRGLSKVLTRTSGPSALSLSSAVLRQSATCTGVLLDVGKRWTASRTACRPTQRQVADAVL